MREVTWRKLLALASFFRARDPAVLTQWYQDHLGIIQAPASYGQSPWQQESGPTIFAPFQQDTSYSGDPKNLWMVNSRVRSLNAMVAQLRAAGISVEIDPEQCPNGRFARLYDPDGNPIELWEPQGGDASGTAA
jgi:catechol 2,3-dioxygenase-like lactoylglutathione lyase family enzyme